MRIRGKTPGHEPGCRGWIGRYPPSGFSINGRNLVYSNLATVAAAFGRPMKITTIIPFLAGCANLALGVYVLTRDRTRAINRAFFAMTLALTFWCTGEFIMRLAADQTTAVWGARIGSLGWCLAGVFLVHFALILSDLLRKKWARILLLSSYLAGIALVVMTWTSDLVFEGFVPGKTIYEDIGGPLRFPSKLFVAALMIAAIILFLYTYFSSPPGARRSSAGYLALAAAIPVTMGIFSDILLPALKVEFPLSSMSVSPFMAAIVAYAITRHQLLSTVAGTVGGAIVSNIREGLLITDTGGFIETVNPAMLELTGYLEAELIGTPSDRLFIDYPESSSPAGGSDADGGRWSLCTTRNGELIPVTRSTGEVRNHGGRSLGNVVLVHDMREALRLLKAEREIEMREAEVKAERDRSELLRRSREELKELSEFLESAIENIAEPLFIKDRDLRFVYVNRAFCELLKSSRGDLIGKTSGDLVPSEMAAELDRQDFQVFDELRLVEIEHEVLVDFEGVPHDIRAVKGPLRGTGGEVDYLVGIINDVTEQKRLDKARLDFIRVAAHELRTPLTSLKLGFELLAKETRGALDPEQQRSLDILSLSIERLSRLARNLLDLASMDAGLLTLVKEPVDVGELLGDAVTMFENQLREKNLYCEFEPDGEVGSVLGDRNRLSQVMFNLVGNAIKYTEDGGVTVSARPTGDGFVEISVSDTGPGIPASEKESVFSRFVKVEKGDISRGGTGLGLSISKTIVEAHGGEIGLDSRPGRGSRFYFTVPEAAPRQ